MLQEIISDGLFEGAQVSNIRTMATVSSPLINTDESIFHAFNNLGRKTMSVVDIGGRSWIQEVAVGGEMFATWRMALLKFMGQQTTKIVLARGA